MTPRGPAPPGKKPDAIIAIGVPKKPGGGPPPLGPVGGDGPEESSDGECSSCMFFDGSNRCLKFPPLGGDWARVLPEDFCSFYESGPNHSHSPDAGAPPHSEPDEDDAAEQAGAQMGDQ